MTIANDHMPGIPAAFVDQLGLLGEAALQALGPAHEVLTHAERGPYLEKWRLVSAADGTATLIHRFLRSDGDDELHDHPWDNASLIISGGYWDVTADGRQWLKPGTILHRKARDFHRVELEPGIIPISLFWHGPKVNNWGFRSLEGEKISAAEFMAR